MINFVLLLSLGFGLALPENVHGAVEKLVS